jgi:predicted nuclease with RNAse H fold
MPTYIGIDAGSFSTPSWAAVLDGDSAVLDAIQFSFQDRSPLGTFLDDPNVLAVAIDAPQGLPEGLKPRRICDKAADTPTRRLPATRAEMVAGCCTDGTKLPYQTVLCLGVELFLGHCDQVLGIPDCDTPRLVETYPRAIYRCLTGNAPPSKRQTPLQYMTAVYSILGEQGIRCPGVQTPSTDQADALLCALVARMFAEDKALCVGKAPWVDHRENVLREGFIVLPDQGLMKK